MEVIGKMHGRAASRQEQTPVTVTWEATRALEPVWAFQRRERSHTIGGK